MYGAGSHHARIIIIINTATTQLTTLGSAGDEVGIRLMLNISE